MTAENTQTYTALVSVTKLTIFDYVIVRTRTNIRETRSKGNTNYMIVCVGKRWCS